eukprot:CAMPEP_0194375166 /NCGR_PEP_ID=MMETSP0174-20130528/23635_1 /TAXON_ID=216777 /ORGANISM="Proboscia alata, Strain PI-D3" /LENGTH=167 /DNA_ID=CAMNT_0039155181 /DNA_START=37 /DNA_END=536 /DNA_ORIENTATION=-
MTALTLLSALILTPLELTIDPSSTPNVNVLPTIQLQTSTAHALTEQQLLVAQAWKEATNQFVDPTFNNLGEDQWKQIRLKSVVSIAENDPDDKQEVYATITKMLKNLGDPYTRYLTPDQYASLTAYATGKSTAGLGIQLLLDPGSGSVVVMTANPEAPARKAGVLPG